MDLSALTDGELLGLPGCGKSTVLAAYARRHGAGAVDPVPAGASLAKLANLGRGVVRLRGELGLLVGLCLRCRRLPLRALAVLFERAGRRAGYSGPVLTDEGLLQAVWAVHWRLGDSGGLAAVVSRQVETVIYIRCSQPAQIERLAARDKGGAFDRAVAAGDMAAISRARRAMAQLLRSLRAAGRSVRLVRSAP